MAPPAPLGPGWRVTGGGVMARHWQDACVDAVAKLPPLRAPQFLGNDPAWSFAPSSNPRPTRDATTGRLTTAHDWRGHRSRSRAGRTGQCQCSRVIAPPGALGRTWLTCHWWPRDGKALAGRVRRCCREAAARLAPRFGERSRVELRSLVSVRSVRDATHPDSSMRWRTDAVAVSWLRPRPWDLVGVSLVAA